jgi:hypothetical protein
MQEPDSVISPALLIVTPWSAGLSLSRLPILHWARRGRALFCSQGQLFSDTGSLEHLPLRVSKLSLFVFN